MKKHNVFIILFLFLTSTLFAVEPNHFSTESFKVYAPCDACKLAIEKAVQGDAISNAFWDAKTQTLTVTFNPHEISVAQLHAMIAKNGFDTDKVKATGEAAKCCQK
ncbi:MAG: heavy-metal-associated domain-containing protein [Cytophagaceae bacterium]